MITVKKTFRHRFFLIRHGEDISEVSSFLFSLEARGLSIETRRAYAFDLLSFHRFIDERHLDIERLQQKHALDYIVFLQSANAAPKTINRRITTVRLYLNHRKAQSGDTIFASRQSFYKGRRNTALLGPSRIKTASRMLSVKTPRKIVTSISNEIIRRFFARLKSFRDRAIVSLMLFCGLRSCEVVNLMTHDIDLNKLELRVSGKGGKERILPFPAFLKNLLESYFFFERQNIAHNSCFVVLKGYSRGKPVRLSTIRKIFRNRRAVPELKDANPHRFRHTFCTSLVREKVPLPVVQKLMGHADIGTTLIYTHLSIEDINAEYQKAIQNISGYLK